MHPSISVLDGYPMITRELLALHCNAHGFGIPVASGDVDFIEQQIEFIFPLELRSCYLSFNGFLGPTDACFLWPLRNSGGLGILEMNRSLRSSHDFPRQLMEKCLFFGDWGTGPYWGYHKDCDGVIAWDGEWGDAFEVRGMNLLEAWKRGAEDYRDPTASAV